MSKRFNFDHPLFSDPAFCSVSTDFAQGACFMAGYMASVFDLSRPDVSRFLDEFQAVVDRGEFQKP